MSDLVTAAPLRTVSSRGSLGDRFTDPILTGYGWLIYLFLYAPILVVVIYAFNDSRDVQVWDHLGLSYWRSTWSDPTIRASLFLSIWTAAANAVIATVLGTSAAIGLRNVGKKTRTAYDVALYSALIVPEIVIAIASLLFFTTVGLPLGAGAIVLTHAVFNTSVVTLIVRARLAGMDRTTEEAAADLGATKGSAFARVTLPQLTPAIVAGALLAFTFSFDDVVLSTFVSSPGATTLPLRIFSELRFGLTPKANVVATSMLSVTLTFVVIAQLVSRRAERRAAAVAEGPE